jgi:GT2 family glycosyltransferase
VVVATRDRPQQLDGCLAALAVSVGAHDTLIVVDSCSSGPDTAAVARRHGAVVIQAPAPGASRARNIGWRAASDPVVAFVDDDVRVAPSWAQGLRDAFAAHPGTAFVSGRLGLRPEDAGARRPVAFIDHPCAYEIDGGWVDDLGHGANLAVRRSALEAVGGYDERLGPGAPWPAAEDLELLDRLLAAGLRGRYEPSASAYHVQWRRRRELPGLEWRYGVGQGARLVRLRRLDPARYRALARLVWGRQGVAELARCLRRREELGTLMVLARLAGTAFGQLTATAASPAASDA